MPLEKPRQLPLPMSDGGCCSETFRGIDARNFGVEPDLLCANVQNCCGRRTDWPVVLERTLGYTLPRAGTIADVPDLPNVIHSFKGDMSHIPYIGALEGMVWAMRYSRALAGTLKSTTRLSEWMRNQKLSTEKLVLFHQETRDKDLERLFKRTFLPNFFPTVGAVSNCLMVSPGYSVYDNGSMCRHHQLYNLWRSIDFFVRACDHGIPCVPSLGWNLKVDLERIAEWLNLHPSLRYVAINCQTIRQNQFGDIADALSYIESMSRELRWVVFGGPKIIEYLSARGFGERLHLVTTRHVEATKAGTNLDASHYVQDRRERFLNNYHTVAKTFG
ncbi:MAG: hypothetical protein V4671_09620 [Armatimonadota bacterium]